MSQQEAQALTWMSIPCDASQFGRIVRCQNRHEGTGGPDVLSYTGDTPRVFGEETEMVHRVLRFTATASMAAALMAWQPPAEAEGPSLQYARGWDSSARPYGAISVTRRDLAGSDISTSATGCGSNDWYTGNVVYQTQWLQSDDASLWLEFGTGHQCDNTRIYRYWGYGQSGVWHSIAHNLIPGDTVHLYRIVEATDSPSVWWWRLDGNNTYGAYLSQFTHFANAVAGVESWAPNGYVKPHFNYDLAYQEDGRSTWVDWAGKDGHDDFSANVAMCGFWDSATSWKAGETNSCT